MNPRLTIRATALMALAVALAGTPAAAATFRGVQPAVRFDVSPPLAAVAPAAGKDAALAAGLLAEPLPAPVAPRASFVADPLAQDWVGALAIPAPAVSFDGPSRSDSAVPTTPPDPSGDVGPDHYVVMSNLVFSVYSKAGVKLYGPAANNTLWAGFGGPCEAENAGQPIVVYDQFADRWLLTQHTGAGPTYYVCLALSATGDPLGSYYRWAFPTGGGGTNLADDPKYAVWGNGYYLGTRERQGAVFQGVGVYAFDRAAMLAGESAPVAVSFLMPPSDPPYEVGDGLLPADVDGATPPPAGAPAVFVGALDDGALYSDDALTIWRFTIDFATPGDASFAWAVTLPLADLDTSFATPAVIPQPGTATLLDTGAYRQRPMHRVVYRNFGDHEALVGNLTVEGAPDMTGIRWWEVRDPNGMPDVYQEGTYVPGATDGIHRWMGSAAMDVEGNLALGYSASNGSVFPSIYYTGRLAGDEPGTLPQGEGVLHAGLFAQTTDSRWGTYSSMSVDPADDCSFWYVNEYMASTGANWRLRIGSFAFAECDQPDFTIGAAPSAQAICAGAPAAVAVDLGALRGFASEVTLAVAGQPAGTTAGFTVGALTPPGASTLDLTDTALAAPGTYLLTVTGTAGAAAHAADTALRVDAPLAAGPALVAPADNATDQPLTPTLSWGAAAGATGYFVELDDDSLFATPEFTATTTGTAVVATGLVPLHRYYWRVTAVNACGEQASGTFSLTTAARFCRAPGVAIPDPNPSPSVDDLLTLEANGTVIDLDVTIKITHPWVGDLKVTLSHGGSPVVLINRPGYTGSGFGCGKPQHRRPGQRRGHRRQHRDDLQRHCTGDFGQPRRRRSGVDDAACRLRRTTPRRHLDAQCRRHVDGRRRHAGRVVPDSDARSDALRRQLRNSATSAAGAPRSPDRAPPTPPQRKKPRRLAGLLVPGLSSEIRSTRRWESHCPRSGQNK